MSDCKNNPVELIIATTDKNLYDITNKKWKWSGTLYWAVECLSNRQTSVSDRIVPNIPANMYIPLDKSPSNWDYCKSRNCNPNSVSMHIIFTFNPNSKNPADYLQFVTDIYCHVTDFPQHYITDSAGKEWYIDITEVSKSVQMQYVELWIAQGHKSNVLKLNNANPIDIPQYSPITNNNNIHYWPHLLLLLFIGIFGILGIVYWPHRKNIYNSLLNIG